MTVVIGDIHGDFRIILEILLNELNLTKICYCIFENNNNLLCNEIIISYVERDQSTNTINFVENIEYIRMLTNSFNNAKIIFNKYTFHIKCFQENNLIEINNIKIICLGDIFDVGSHTKEYIFSNSMNIENYKTVYSILTYKLIEYLKTIMKQNLILIYGNHEITNFNNYNYLLMRDFIFNNFVSFYYDNLTDSLYTHYKSTYLDYSNILQNNDDYFQNLMKNINSGYSNLTLLYVKNLLIKQKNNFNKYKIKNRFIGHLHNDKIINGNKYKIYFIDVNMSKFKNDNVYNTMYIKQTNKNVYIFNKIKNNLFENITNQFLKKDIYNKQLKSYKEIYNYDININILYENENENENKYNYQIKYFILFFFFTIFYNIILKK